jgi:Sec7-like guanine-nucleotide exchange factor
MDSLLDAEDARIEAVYQFNASPNKNIGKLCAFFHRDVTPNDVAAVIHTTQGLLGEKIGEFLAKPDHIEFLKAYFRQIDLHVNFLEAMRRGLSGPFFMPGEAQQVERTIQALSEVFMEQNPEKFGHVNDPVVLGFALVMLNTDMLKPNVTRKMTMPEFVANTGGAFEHSQFPRDELELMYQSLKEAPFAFAPKSNDFMALCAPKKRGWLKKKSARFGGSWNLHYFVLANSSLFYFKDEKPESKDHPLGVIQLVEVDTAIDSRAPNRFVVAAKQDQLQYVKLVGIPQMVAGVKKVIFEAKSGEEASEWLFRLKRSVCMGSFMDGEVQSTAIVESDGE